VYNVPLELAPETEASVREYAERRGVTVDEMLARAFPPVQTDRDRVMALLHRWQEESGGMPPRPGGGPEHIPVSQLMAEWDAEDAMRTPEQIEADTRLWESLVNDPHPLEL
jgi:hypothetical protein